MTLTQRLTRALLLLLLVGAWGPARAQTPGTCQYGTAEADLDANNVLARVFNTGTLFYGNATTNGDGYLAPKASGASPVYASGIWVGGEVDGAVRVAGATYRNYNFWPGPLGADGRPVNPVSCSAYDKIYDVRRSDIAEYAATGVATADLRDWPVDLGAPVVDGDGNPSNYNLAGGDRPGIIGDQGLFWVMNDVGGPHTAQQSDPLGIEVQVLAFSFARADAIGNTTFYRYRVINKGPNTIENTYLGVFSDPDLGDSRDDYVGYDKNLAMGFVYNAGARDATYGDAPPAAGYDFFQGPIVPDGDDAGSDPDTLGATAFAYFSNADGPTSDPALGTEIYNYLQGLWKDGEVMRLGGTGYAGSGEPTKFAFPGDPVRGEFWSEVNTDGAGARNAGADRRFVISTGPFTLSPGDAQDIVFGIVFAQGSDNISSITALRAADILAQNAYNANFNLPPPPPPPPLCTEATAGSGKCLEAIELDRKVTLVWGYPESSDNYLLGYEARDPFLAGQGADDDTYNFEGFNIYRYTTSSFDGTTRQLVATYDIVNGVTRVVDQIPFPAGGLQPIVSANGTDSGIQYSITFEGLTNATDYYYGITAYAYNAESDPKVLESDASRITVTPIGLTQGIEARSVYGDSLNVAVQNLVGEGRVQAVVVDPTRITGDTYEVKFYRALRADGSTSPVTTYDIVNSTTGEVKFNGQAYYNANGVGAPIGQNVQIIDGFSYTILQPEPRFTAFKVVQNAGGPLNMAGAPSAHPLLRTPANYFPIGNGDPLGPDQQFTNNRIWLFHTGDGSNGVTEANGTYQYFFDRTTRDKGLLPNLGYTDYEMRFTGSSIAYKGFQTVPQDSLFVTVPFELWDIGENTPDDPSDDVRLIPEMFDVEQPGFANGNGRYNLFGDHVVHSGTTGASADPATDWIYWNRPVNGAAGQAGYQAYANGGTPDTDQIGDEIMARTVLVALNGGGGPNYNPALPEEGTIFRIETQKGISAGSVFRIDTANLNLTTPTAESQELALDRIQVVPNPYRGSSTYESGNLSRVVRFTNIPPQAVTIRIYTVAGTLIRTLRKEGDSRILEWNLETENNLPVASGMYFIHVDVEGVGERILKFGVVQRRTQISVF